MMWSKLMARLNSAAVRVVSVGASARAANLLVEARDVLEELVTLKRMHDDIEANPKDPLKYRKQADYVHRKRIAWRRAREWIEWAEK